MKHGYAGYKDKKCRCEVCVQDNKRYHNERNRKEREKAKLEMQMYMIGPKYKHKVGKEPELPARRV